MEDKSNSCATCNASLDELGLCPRCLLANVLEPTSAPPSGLPDIANIAKAFPDLEIIELIGKGGMGAVYKARQKSLDRLVALKLLPESLAGDPAFAARFHDEAKALATLNHPNIVTIHDFGQQEGFYFLLMEYIDGPNLRHLIKDRSLSPEEALAIIPPLCEALQFAHDHQIVHRDIKPENLLLDTKGRIKIADFGIAKIIDRDNSVDLHSSGTPAYMAPEQKKQPHAVDARSDIYSLGVVLYEMLTGERPGSSLTPPSQKAILDVRIDEVVLRALDSQPDQRWQSATALQSELQTILTESTPSPSLNSFPESSPKKAYWALALTLLSFLILTIPLLKVKPTRGPIVHSAQDQAELEQLQAKREELDAAARKALASDLPSEDFQKENARINEEAGKVQAKINSFNVSKKPNQLVPILLTVGTLGLGIGSVFTGLTLGWRHLSSLRGQSPDKPALVPGLIAALLWPLLIISIVIYSLEINLINDDKWADIALTLVILSVICLDLWIISKTLAWINNEAHPISRNRWLLTLPLIALALLLVSAAFAQDSKQEISQGPPAHHQEIHNTPNPDIQFLEATLTHLYQTRAGSLASGLGSQHPEVRAGIAQISAYEDHYRHLGTATLLSLKHRVLNRMIADEKARLVATITVGIGSNHPEARAVQQTIDDLEKLLSELPPVKTPDSDE